MESSKRPALVALARILADAALPYAVIGGVALQIHQREPRTTLDIDLAVADRHALPRPALEAAGFSLSGDYVHSQNWVGPEATPVQFTDDPALVAAIGRAETIDLDGAPLRILARVDLLHEKLRAGIDPGRRRSKRLQDLADAQALLEQDPALADALSDGERAVLEALPK